MRRFFLIAFTIGLLAGVGAAPAFAQDDTPDPPINPGAIVSGGIFSDSVSALFLRVTQTGPLENLVVEGPEGVFSLTSTGPVLAGETVILTSSVMTFSDMPETVRVFPGLPDFGASFTSEGESVTVSWSPPDQESLDSIEVALPITPDTEDEETIKEDSEDIVEDVRSFSGIRFHSLFPNPVGSDADGEVIVLETTAEEHIDLAGASLTDGTATFVFPEGTVLVPGTPLVLDRATTRIALNNTGTERLQLFSPADLLLDEVEYSGSFEGERFVRTEDGWMWEHEMSAQEDVSSHQAQPLPEEEVLNDEESHEEPEPSPTPQPVSNGHLAVLSEYLPAPLEDASAEWIELFNPTATSLNLSGYQLDDVADAGSTPYVFPEHTYVLAHSYLVVPKEVSGISLNNNGDAVRFLHPDGTVVHETSYESSQRGWSYSFVQSEWKNTLPTPGAENTVEEEESVEVSHTEEEPSDAPEQAQEERSIDDAPQQDSEQPTQVSVQAIRSVRGLPEESTVRISGIVTAEARGLLSNGLVLQDETSGIQVIFSRDDVPTVPVGSRVELTGTIDTYRSATVVRAASADVQILEEGASPDAEEHALAELGPHVFGMRIRTSGFVLSKNGQTIVLEDEGTELRVTFRERTGVEKPSWQTGSRVSVSGLLLQTSDGWRLYPSVEEDVLEEELAEGEKEGAPPVAGSTSPENGAPDTHSSNLYEQAKATIGGWSATDIAVALVVLATLSLMAGWSLWKRYGDTIKTRIHAVRLRNA